MIEMWDVRTQNAVAKLTGLSEHLFGAWSPNGGHIAVDSRTDMLTVIDITAGRTSRKEKFNHGVCISIIMATSKLLVIVWFSHRAERVVMELHQRLSVSGERSSGGWSH